MKHTTSGLPTVVIGAGPVGLAMAAHLKERELPFIVLESGAGVGAAIQEWGHVQLFSPWRYNIDDAARKLLETTEWVSPDPEILPSGQELIDNYLIPLEQALGSSLKAQHTVLAVTRFQMDKTKTTGRESAPFVVRVKDQDGQVFDVLAQNVIDASGTWRTPNPLGSGGIPAVGEEMARRYGHITSPLPNVNANKEQFAGKRVLVVGGGHSAANTILELAELKLHESDTQVEWLSRSKDLSRVYGGGDNDELAARGALGSRLRELVTSGVVTVHTSSQIVSFHVEEDVRVRTDTPAGSEELVVDVVIPATGFRPDLSMLSELRLSLDDSVEAPSKLGPLIDPEFHSCGTVEPHGEKVLAHPEPGFYIVGMKSYGRAPTFLMATGYEQVRSIAAALAGDRVAADNVHLELPETGVCSANLPTPSIATPSGLGAKLSITPGGACCS